MKILNMAHLLIIAAVLYCACAEVSVGEDVAAMPAVLIDGWRVELDPLQARRPFQVVVEGGNRIQLDDIAVNSPSPIR